MKNIIGRFLRYQAMNHNRLVLVWRLLGAVRGDAWADYQRIWGGFQHIGSHCSMWPGTRVMDPAYVWIGDNVAFSLCTIVGHDGSVPVLNRAYGVNLEGVGYTVIQDNVFIGFGAVLMPNVVIGNNSIVAAGSVVTSDVPAGAIVGGVPAKVIGQTDDLVKRWQDKTERLPWYDLLQQRGVLGYDPSIEPELVRRRVEYFYGSNGVAGIARNEAEPLP